jgi:ABC-2 type transport system ATP-binding protein
MTQRLCLGRSLLHDPQVLIMDEPAAGLDPKARVELKHLIRVLAKEGKTIFISSHILSELGEMCDTLLFLNNGRIVHHGDSESLKRSSDSLGGVLYDVQLDGDPQALSDWAVLQPNVELLESRKTGGRIRIDTEDPAKAADVLSRMVKDNLRVIDFHREQRNLEDAFIDMLSNIENGKQAVRTPPPIPSPIPLPVKGAEEQQVLM